MAWKRSGVRIPYAPHFEDPRTASPRVFKHLRTYRGFEPERAGTARKRDSVFRCQREESKIPSVTRFSQKIVESPMLHHKPKIAANDLLRVRKSSKNHPKNHPFHLPPPWQCLLKPFGRLSWSHARTSAFGLRQARCGQRNRIARLADSCRAVHRWLAK